MRVFADAAPAIKSFFRYRHRPYLEGLWGRFRITCLFLILLRWNPVTTYVNGVPITQPVTYEIWRATNASLNNAVKIGTVGIVPAFSDSNVITGKFYYYYVLSTVQPPIKSGPSNVIKVRA